MKEPILNLYGANVRGSRNIVELKLSFHQCSNLVVDQVTSFEKMKINYKEYFFHLDRIYLKHNYTNIYIKNIVKFKH